MSRYDRWSHDDTPTGDELAKIQRQITETMRGVVADALRPKGDPNKKYEPGEPYRNGVPLRVIEAMEAAKAEQARVEELNKDLVLDWTCWRKPKPEAKAKK